MRILYQWAQRDPTDWQQMDSALWGTLPVRPEPNPGQLGGQNNIPGWLRNVSVQGITCEGYDHVAIEEVVIGLDTGVRLTTWNDDPDDYPLEERQGIVWTILPLAPDPQLGMAINTRQSCVRYCGGARYTRLAASPPQNTTVRPWAEFVAPPAAVTRHGVWLTDAKQAEHVAAAPQARWSWRHAVEHLPENETEIASDGRRALKVQRDLGRWDKAKGTITYYQRNTDRAATWSISTHEDALETTTGAAVSESVTTDADIVQCWAFTTPANEPNSADWPNGAYRAQLDCTAASAGLIYVIRDAASNGSFRRVPTVGGSVSLGAQVEANFSGTGLKLGTRTVDPAAGAADDVYGFGLYADGDSHADAITLQLNTTDSYADGPWPGADPSLAMPPPDQSFGIGRRLVVAGY